MDQAWTAFLMLVILPASAYLTLKLGRLGWLVARDRHRERKQRERKFHTNPSGESNDGKQG